MLKRKVGMSDRLGNLPVERACDRNETILARDIDGQQEEVTEIAEGSGPRRTMACGGRAGEHHRLLSRVTMKHAAEPSHQRTVEAQALCSAPMPKFITEIL